MTTYCPGGTYRAEITVTTEAQLRETLGLAPGGLRHAWLRLADDVELTQTLDLSHLGDCPGYAPTIKFDSYVDYAEIHYAGPYTLRKSAGFASGDPLIKWHRDRFISEPPEIDNAASLRMENIILDGNDRPGPLVDIQQSDYQFFRDVVFKGSGGDGLVLGPPSLDPTQDNAVPECEDPSNPCVGAYQNSMVLLLDCQFLDNAGWGARLTNVIDFTIQGGSASGNAAGAVRVQGPSLCSKCGTPPGCAVYANRKMFRGCGSIVDLAGSDGVYLTFAWGVGVSGSGPVTTGPEVRYVSV